MYLSAIVYTVYNNLNANIIRKLSKSYSPDRKMVVSDLFSIRFWTILSLISLAHCEVAEVYKREVYLDVSTVVCLRPT